MRALLCFAFPGPWRCARLQRLFHSWYEFSARCWTIICQNSWLIGNSPALFAYKPAHKWWALLCHFLNPYIVMRKSQVNNASINICFTFPAPALRNIYWMQRLFFHKQKNCSKPHVILIFFNFRVGIMNFIIFIFRMGDNTVIFFHWMTAVLSIYLWGWQM